MRVTLVVVGLVAICSPARAALTEVGDFGPNPGALKMFTYVPGDMPADAPLLVLLHGCTQPLGDLEKGGWDALAEELKIYLVYAQQATANNQLSCFNWAGEYGDPANMVRGQGENESIKEMVDKMKADHSIAGDRVYVLGFSAGAAMTAVLLATWPDVFAAGAIMSGAPYRCADSVQSALDCLQMNLHPEREKTPEQWGALVREAYPGYAGPWPRVSIWHGSMDGVVSPLLGRELAEQWSNVHGVTAPEQTMVGASSRAVYLRDGVPLVEAWTIEGMGHAVSVGANDPDHPCQADPGSSYYQDKGVCAPYRALDFLGLVHGNPDLPGNDGGAGAGDGGAGGNDPGVGGMGCGCHCHLSSGRSPAAASAALLLALLGLRRRRG